MLKMREEVHVIECTCPCDFFPPLELYPPTWKCSRETGTLRLHGTVQKRAVVRTTLQFWNGVA